MVFIYYSFLCPQLCTEYIVMFGKWASMTDEKRNGKCACVYIGRVMMICVGTRRMLGPECASTLEITATKVGKMGLAFNITVVNWNLLQ